MPYYDYLCAAGHQRESLESRETDSIECDCGQRAQRVVTLRHVPGAIGFTPKPTREHYINVNRARDAQAEAVHIAEKNHIPMPDFWKIAKARVARGDVQAIT